MLYLILNIYDLNILNQSFENKIHGSLIGGCVSVLAGHFGGNYQIDFADKILFLEDEGENGERLDRYFRQIIEVILKTKKPPKAILLGNFMQSNIHGTPKAANIKIAINKLGERIKEFDLKIPLLQARDENLGHSNKMRPLLLGSDAEIILEQNPRLIISI